MKHGARTNQVIVILSKTHREKKQKEIHRGSNNSGTVTKTLVFRLPEERKSEMKESF